MAGKVPTVPFERYADDAVVHWVSQRQAAYVRRAITDRMERVGLGLHPDKTRIGSCKDDKRREASATTSFTFLGYRFRARTARGRNGRFTAFLPAIGKDAVKRLGRAARGWRLHRRTGLSSLSSPR